MEDERKKIDLANDLEKETKKNESNRLLNT